MPDLLAKGVAVTVAVLLAFVLAVLVFTSRPPAGATQVTAEFENVFPLIEGMHVRVDGAIAGSVGPIEVNDRGNAEVQLVLNDSIEEPKTDATAAIRQQDTTGDSYVAFDPGGEESDEPLGEEGLVCESHDRCPRTLVAPRLDDLLNAFGPAERSGIQLILVELAKAMDRRGRDLNRAAIELRPAIESANTALAEVAEQNRALRSLVSSAESVTRQAARRDRELGGMVESLARTLEVTEAEAPALDRALERLPETADRARTTLASLAEAATAARPLALEMADGAPLLASSIERFPGFLDDAAGWLEETRPTLRLTRRLLLDAQPTLEVGKRRVVTGLFDLTGATAELLNSVLGGEDAFPALFGDDSYGVGEGTLGKRGFGAVAVEPGDLLGYPPDHAPRNWLRVSAVINCEVFGVPVRPGCLLDALSNLRASGGSAEAASSGDGGGGGDGGSGAGGAPLQQGGGNAGDGLQRELPKAAEEAVGKLPAVPGLRGLGRKGDEGKGKRGRGKGRPGNGGGVSGRTLEDLLDFLVR